MSSQFYIIVTVMAAAIGVVFLLKYLAYREALKQARCQEDFVEKVAYLALRALKDTERRAEQITEPEPRNVTWASEELEREAYALVNALMRNRSATHSWAAAVLERTGG